MLEVTIRDTETGETYTQEYSYCPEDYCGWGRESGKASIQIVPKWKNLIADHTHEIVIKCKCGRKHNWGHLTKIVVSTPKKSGEKP